VTVQKSLTSPSLSSRSPLPNKTYYATFLANYSYINLNTNFPCAGIASVTVFGAGQYAMRPLGPTRPLAKLNIAVPEIIAESTLKHRESAVRAWRAAPAGRFTYSFSAQGGLQSEAVFAESFWRANPDGSMVRLKTWPSGTAR